MIAPWKRLTLCGLAGLAVGLAGGALLVGRVRSPTPVALAPAPIPIDSLASASEALLVGTYNLSPEWFGRVRPVKLVDAPGGFSRFSREVRVPREVPVAELIRELNLRLKPLGGRAVGHDDIQSHPRVVEIHLLQGRAVRGTLRVIVDADLVRPAGTLAVSLDGVTGEMGPALLGDLLLAVPDPVNLLLDPADPGAPALIEAVRGRADKPVWMQVGWSTDPPDRTRPELVISTAGDSAVVRPLIRRLRRDFPGAAGVALAGGIDTTGRAVTAALAALRRDRIAYRWLEPRPTPDASTTPVAVVAALTAAAVEAQATGRRVDLTFPLSAEVVTGLGEGVARVARRGFRLTPL